ncbi:hypothetical protein HDU86_008420 [Geranomyces michiganensis]|nr:hypothetical protein HDU86_008420 [Geranomyces michiganensis]
MRFLLSSLYPLLLLVGLLAPAHASPLPPPLASLARRQAANSCAVDVAPRCSGTTPPACCLLPPPAATATTIPAIASPPATRAVPQPKATPATSITPTRSAVPATAVTPTPAPVVLPVGPAVVQPPSNNNNSDNNSDSNSNGLPVNLQPNSSPSTNAGNTGNSVADNSKGGVASSDAVNNTTDTNKKVIGFGALAGIVGVCSLASFIYVMNGRWPGQQAAAEKARQDAARKRAALPAARRPAAA